MASGVNYEKRFLLIKRNADGSYVMGTEQVPVNLALTDAETLAGNLSLAHGGIWTVFQAISSWEPPAPPSVTATSTSTKHSHNQ